MNILSHLPSTFQIFSQNYNQTADISILLYALLQFFYFYYVTFCVFTFWEKKKSSQVFNSCLSVLTKFAYFKEISCTWYIYAHVMKNLMYFHHSNPILLIFMPLAVLKQKVGGSSFALLHQKTRLKNPTQNRVSLFKNWKHYYFMIFK